MKTDRLQLYERIIGSFNGIGLKSTSLKAKASEKEKIKRFYIGFALIWLVSVIVYFVGTGITEGSDQYQPLFNIILVFFVILIPVIMILSVPLFFAEGILDRIKAKMDQRKESGD